MGTRERKEGLFEAIAVMGKAFASPKRLELLDLLAQGTRTVEALARASAQSPANASQHLHALHAAGLVSRTREGNRVLYELAGDDVLRLWLALRDTSAHRLAEAMTQLRVVQHQDGGEVLGVVAADAGAEHGSGPEGRSEGHAGGTEAERQTGPARRVGAHLPAPAWRRPAACPAQAEHPGPRGLAEEQEAEKQEPERREREEQRRGRRGRGRPGSRGRSSASGPASPAPWWRWACSAASSAPPTWPC